MISRLVRVKCLSHFAMTGSPIVISWVLTLFQETDPQNAKHLQKCPYYLVWLKLLKAFLKLKPTRVSLKCGAFVEMSMGHDCQELGWRWNSTLFWILKFKLLMSCDFLPCRVDSDQIDERYCHMLACLRCIVACFENACLLGITN